MRNDSRGRSGFHHRRESGIDRIPLKRTARREQLLADGWAMAAEEAQQLFEVFGWDAELALLLDYQRELRGYGQH